MNRRNMKFRCWDTLTKKMYYNGFTLAWNGLIQKVGWENERLAAGWKEWTNEGCLTPMQWTGLFDKKGKEIYDEDIIKVERPEISLEYITPCSNNRWRTSNMPLSR